MQDDDAAPAGARQAQAPGARVRRVAEWSRWSLPLSLALLIALRGALVLSLADVFHYGEELAKGAAGKALLDGLGVETHRLAFHAYEGGGFVVSHLDALAFRLVGQSLLALKLVALSWSCVVLCAGWLLVRRAFGPAAAAAFGLLFALAPATFQKLSLLALGIHFEAGLFVLLVLHLGLRILASEEPRARTWLALGLAAGFGTYFSYQVALVSGFVGCWLLVRRPRSVLGRPGLWGALGALLGLAPFWWMLAHVGGEVLDIHGEALFAAKGRWLARQGAFLGSLLAGRSALDAALVVAWLLAPLVALVALLVASRLGQGKLAATVVGGYLAFFLVVSATSGFAVEDAYHYFRLNRLSQAWLLGSVLVAGAVGQGLERGGRWTRPLAGGALLALCLSGAVDFSRAVRDGLGGSWTANLERLARAPGYGYLAYLGEIGEHLPGAPADKLAAALRFQDPAPAALRADAGMVLLSELAEDLDQAVALARAADPQDWRALLLGLGPLWSRLHGFGFEGRLAALEGLDDRLLEPLAEAQGRFGESFRVTTASLQREIDRALELEVPAAWLRGLGYRAWRVHGSGPPRGVGAREPLVLFALDPAAGEAFQERQDERARPYLLEGWRRASLERTLP